MTDSGPYIKEANRIVECVLLSLICVVAIVGNISIWIIVCRIKKLRTVTNAFILGLSMADLLVSCVNMPVTVYTIAVGSWVLTDSACITMGFINMLTLVTSVISLCNISINRYIMVVKPSKFKNIYTRLNAGFMILAVVTLSALLSSPPLMGWGVYSYIPIQSFCFCDWSKHMSYAFFMIGACFGGPLSVMTICNIFIFREVRNSRRRVKTVISPKRSSSSGAALISQDSTQSEGVTPVKNADQNDNSRGGDLLHPTWRSRTSGMESESAEIFQIKPKDNATVKDVSFNLAPESEDVKKQLRKKPRRVVSKMFSKRMTEEVRLAVSLLVVVVCFVLCWLPYCISMILSIFVPEFQSREFHMFTLLIGYANSCCNPIIYGLMNKRYGDGFRHLYCRSCVKQELRNSTSTSV